MPASLDSTAEIVQEAAIPVASAMSDFDDLETVFSSNSTPYASLSRLPRNICS